MKFAADAKALDQTYTSNLNPRFQIEKNDLTPQDIFYDFSLRVKDSLLLTGSSFPTVAAAKETIKAIQAGKYTWRSESVPIGPVGHMTIEVLADSAGQTLAQVSVEYGRDLVSVKADVEKFAPMALVEEPTSHVLV